MAQRLSKKKDRYEFPKTVNKSVDQAPVGLVPAEP